MNKIKLTILALVITIACFAQETFNLNDRVEAEDKGQWYKATVIRGKGGQHFKDGKYFIHWDGYAASYDVWIEASKIRKPQTSQSKITYAPEPTNNAINTSLYKVGDKIVCMTSNFPSGTISEIKGGYYYIDITDGSDKQLGKNGLLEKDLMPVWQYKEFFAELRELVNSNPMVSTLARLVCDQCQPNGELTYGYSLERINKGKVGYEKLRALVNKYSPLPDNGKKSFQFNPALVAKVSSKSDSIVAKMLSDNFKERMRFWFDADMYFFDFTYETNSTDHVLFSGKSYADFAMCGSLNELKDGLKKNLSEVINKNGLSGTPDEYLKGFDENFEKRKAKLIEEANANTWVKSDYPYLDNSMNVLLTNGNLKTQNTYFNATTFDVKKDDAGYITEQAKGGVVIYQKPGCSFWMWQYITAYKPYLGNGKYGATKMRFMDYGFIKPF